MAKKQKVSDENVEKVVREYIERMVKSHKIQKGVSIDDRIDCPHCKRSWAMLFSAYDKRWYCSWLDCQYQLPIEFSPPKPDNFKDLIKLQQCLNFLKKWSYLFDEGGEA